MFKIEFATDNSSFPGDYGVTNVMENLAKISELVRNGKYDPVGSSQIIRNEKGLAIGKWSFKEED